MPGALAKGSEFSRKLEGFMETLKQGKAALNTSLRNSLRLLHRFIPDHHWSKAGELIELITEKAGR